MKESVRRWAVNIKNNKKTKFSTKRELGMSDETLRS